MKVSTITTASLLIIWMVAPYGGLPLTNSTSTLAAATTEQAYECVISTAECDFNSHSFDPQRCCGCYERTGNNDICESIDRKSQLTGFLLQLLIPGPAVGMWYLSYHSFAASQMIIWLIALCGKVVINGSKDNHDGPIFGVLMCTCCFGLAVLVMQIWALVLIGINDILVDGCFPKSWNC